MADEFNEGHDQTEITAKEQDFEHPIDVEGVRFHVPDDDDQQIITTMVNDMYDEARGNRRDWEEKLKNINNFFEGNLPKTRDWPWKNARAHHVPLLTSQILAGLARDVAIVLGEPEAVKAQPIGSEDPAAAKVVSEYMNAFVGGYARRDYAPAMFMWFLGRRMDGMSVLKRYPKRRTFPDGTVDWYTSVELIDILDFYWPANAKMGSVDELIYCGQYIRDVPYDELKRNELEGTMFNVTDRLNKWIQDGRSDEPDVKRAQREAEGVEQSRVYSLKKLVNIVEWYFRYDINKDGLDELCEATVQLDARILLRLRQVPETPFAIARYFPRKDSFVGLSMGELLLWLNEDMNSIHNMRADANTLATMPPTFYEPRGGFDPNQIMKLAPGRMLPVRHINALKQFEFRGAPENSYRDEQNLLSWAERVGMSDLNQGRMQEVAGQRPTWRGTQARLNESQYQTNMYVDVLSWAIGELFPKVATLERLLMPGKGRVLRTIGPDGAEQWERFRPEEIGNQYDYIIAGNASRLTPGEERDTWHTLFDKTATYLMQPALPHPIREILKQLFVRHGIKDVNNYLPPEAQSQPILRSPDEEHKLMMAGTEVDPNPIENLMMHLQEHDEFEKSPMFGQVRPERLHLFHQHKMKTVTLLQQQFQQAMGGPPGPPRQLGPPQMAPTPQVGAISPQGIQEPEGQVMPDVGLY